MKYIITVSLVFLSYSCVASAPPETIGSVEHSDISRENTINPKNGSAVPALVASPVPSPVTNPSQSLSPTGVPIHLASLNELPVDINTNVRWEGATYHVHSLPGLKALASAWGVKELRSNVDFNTEELWISFARGQAGCGPPLLDALVSNGSYLAPRYVASACQSPSPVLGQGPVVAQVYAYPRQALPVLPAIEPEVPQTELAALKLHTLGFKAGDEHAGVNSFIVANDGTLWIVADSATFAYHFAKDGTALGQRAIPSVAQDIAAKPNGDLYVASNPIVRLDAMGASTPINLDSNAYDCIGIDGLGRIWVQRRDAESSLPIRVFSETGQPLVTAPDATMNTASLVRGSDGSMWGYTNDVVTSFDASARAAATFPMGNIYAMGIDRSGSIWVVNGEGLFTKSDAKGRPLAYYTVAGLSEVSPGSKMQFAPDGALWLSSPRSDKLSEIDFPNP